MQSSSSSSSTVAERRVAKFETFINDVLKDSLNQIFAALDAVNGEIMELTQVEQSIVTMNRLADDRSTATAASQGRLKTRVNVGCDYYMQADVDLARYMVCVGLGCYVEFTKDEALAFVRHRADKLRNYANELRDKGARVRAQITLALHCIQEVQNIP